MKPKKKKKQDEKDKTGGKESASSPEEGELAASAETGPSPSNTTASTAGGQAEMDSLGEMEGLEEMRAQYLADLNSQYD